MIRSVAKHSYIKGRFGTARGRAHINYIAHRSGEDLEAGGRRFFDRERDDIDAHEVKDLMYDRADERGVTMHKLILSPGMQEVDAARFTREVMDLLEHEKRQELEWRAVVHENTDHRHVHVVIMGTDKDGHKVKLDREDYKNLREFGDEYLNREHKLERYLDREMERLLTQKEYDRGGDERFRNLLYGSPDKELEREREKEKRDRDLSQDPDRDRRDFDKFEKDMKRALGEREAADIYLVKGSQRRLEQKGNLSEFHGHYTDAMARERAEEVCRKFPELGPDMAKELQYLDELARENAIAQKRDPALDRLFGAQEQDRSREFEDRSWQSFESDRMGRAEQDRNEDKEREREDDLERGGDR